MNTESSPLAAFGWPDRGSPHTGLSELLGASDPEEVQVPCHHLHFYGASTLRSGSRGRLWSFLPSLSRQHGARHRGGARWQEDLGVDGSAGSARVSQAPVPATEASLGPGAGRPLRWPSHSACGLCPVRLEFGLTVQTHAGRSERPEGVSPTHAQANPPP